MHRTTRRQLVGLAIGAAFVLTASLLFSPARILQELAGMRTYPVLFAVGLLAVYLLRSAVAWPISAISLVVGFVYGPVVGFPIALVGAVVTAVPPYVVARHVQNDQGALGWLGDSGNRLFTAAGDFRGIVGARLAPLPTDAVSYGAGLSGVALVPYVAGTFVGEAPWVAAAVVAGASMGQLTVRAASTASVPVALGGAALAILLLGGPAYRHFVGEYGAQ